jgi:hypothetical protein
MPDGSCQRQFTKNFLLVSTFSVVQTSASASPEGGISAASTVPHPTRSQTDNDHNSSLDSWGEMLA